jgi:hypothetical protein
MDSGCFGVSFSDCWAVDRAAEDSVVAGAGLLAVVGRPCEETLVTFFMGTAISSDSRPLDWSGAPQQFRKENRPLGFFATCPEADCVIVGPAPAVFPSAVLGDVTDFLLLATLPFRSFPIILDRDSLDRLPMLSFGSLAVAPLSPVDVGEG